MIWIVMALVGAAFVFTLIVLWYFIKHGITRYGPVDKLGDGE